VTTSSAAQLYGLTDGAEVVAVEFTDGFAEAILRLLRCEQPVWKRLSNGGARVRETKKSACKHASERERE
jgi:hypothetical protein